MHTGQILCAIVFIIKAPFKVFVAFDMHTLLQKELSLNIYGVELQSEMSKLQKTLSLSLLNMSCYHF